MERMRNKVDRRVMYTKMFLRDSLLELMREKPIGKITPTEICRRADINRNTFYAHYDGPEALLKSIEDDLYEQIRSSLVVSQSDRDIQLMLTDICQAIQKNHDLCKVIFSEHGDKAFLKRIINFAHDLCIAEWKSSGMCEDGGQMEMLYAFTSSGIVAIIEQWILEDMIRSAEETARIIAKLASFSRQAFIE
jgi:AcrR family transcriptional regulator